VCKLDRLSCDAHFISELMAKKVSFIVAGIRAEVDLFVLHLYAASAEKERAPASKRTKEGLAAAKAKGRKLGGYHPHRRLPRLPPAAGPKPCGRSWPNSLPCLRTKPLRS
jgi:DNA invertase Pin-like site-specific DNA recombinase